VTLLLGLESSCDDTCASIVADGRSVLSNVISSQEALHERFAGVVPEIASRAHLERMLPVIEEAFEKAGCKPSDLSAIAISNRPGLIGGLLVSLTTAKALCATWNLPLIAVSHIHAHLYAGIMTSPEWKPPAIALTASGGHTLLCRIDSALQFEVIGRTIDDAGGEAFDKGANLLGLTGKGGAALERLAKMGNPKAFKFPRPLISGGWNFSFAGLKTALLYEMFGPGGKPSDVAHFDERKLADLAASYQEAICDVLARKTIRAAEEFTAKTIFVTGGVAANSRLRVLVEQGSILSGARVVFPPMALCADNAAMIAGLAFEYYRTGMFSPLDTEAFARSAEQGRA
jgi:N6-L-threonylcarbamoyladenine synthase